MYMIPVADFIATLNISVHCISFLLIKKILTIDILLHTGNS